jgi:hypothetical protein
MARRLSRTTTIMAATGCILLLGAVSAWAAYSKRVIVGGVYSQHSSTTAGVGVEPGPCPDGSCAVLFQVVPNGRQMIIEHVACNISMSPSTANLSTVFLQSDVVDRAVRLIAIESTPGTFGVNSPVLYPLAANEKPRVTISADQTGVTIGATCTIAGRLVTP